jgi:hypothetical protein
MHRMTNYSAVEQQPHIIGPVWCISAQSGSWAMYSQSCTCAWASETGCMTCHPAFVIARPSATIGLVMAGQALWSPLHCKEHAVMRGDEIGFLNAQSTLHSFRALHMSSYAGVSLWCSAFQPVDHLARDPQSLFCAFNGANNKGSDKVTFSSFHLMYIRWIETI